MKKTILALALVAGLTSFAGSAKAQSANLLSNPGFESGNYSGWSLGSPAYTYLTVVPNGANVYSYPSAYNLDGGNYEYAMPTWTSLSQTFETIAGQNYDISIQVNGINAGASGSTLEINWNGLTVLSAPGNYADWSTLRAIGVATSSSSTVNFKFNASVGVYYADNASVTAVPEPSTYALFGIGALALVIAYRRKVA